MKSNVLAEKLNDDECEIARLVFLRARKSMQDGTAGMVRRIAKGPIGTCDCGWEPQKLTSKANARFRAELRRLWPQVRRATDRPMEIR